MKTTPIYEFLDILEARANNDRKALNEASLSRVWQHLNDSDKKNFAILTSNRGSNSRKVNANNFKELISQIREAGLGFFKIEGRWRECPIQGMDYSKCPEELLLDVSEPNLFVPGISFKLAKQMMSLYQQDAILYSGPETNGIPALLYNDNRIDLLPDFKPDTVSQVYSRLKTKHGVAKDFVFSYPAQSPGEVMIERLFNHNY